MDNKSDLKSVGSKSNSIDSWTKVGLWLFVPGVILALLEFSLIFFDVKVSESTLEDWGVMMILPLILIGYGALFLLPVLLSVIGSFLIELRLIRKILELALGAARWAARLIWVPLSFVLSLAFVILLLALGFSFLYLAYLFVLWAGLIGTLLLIIAILLFVLIILSLSRR